MTSPIAQVRKMLVLIPEAWRAGPEGLPVEKAMKVTGARSVKEIEEIVSTLGMMEFGPSMPDGGLLVSIEDGRVFVDRGLHLTSPPPLSLREGAALLAALRPFERNSGKAVASAIRKLLRAVPEPFRQDAESLARTIDFQVNPPGEWADSLAEAIERRLEVAVDYRAVASGTVAQRTLEPRAVFHKDGHWYLAAWNVAKEEEHLFRLDRIASVVIGTRFFGEHKGPPLDRFRTRQLYFQSGSERDVIVRFTGEAAALALEQWPDRATTEDDDSVTVRARLAPGNFLLGWVLGHGGQAEVAGPPDVREQLVTRVAELSRMYAR
jgi:proteasome accessory factor C